ncbi:MAG: glycosyl transferase [Candidatus Rokuibacteriota bacterium]|nr:MAG: glycosyl transferase [Candidatus Rokubacteria bacterium]
MSQKSARNAVLTSERPRADGKSLFIGEEQFFVRGVTYGTFRPNDETQDFPDRQAVAQDFAAMAANGINAVRVYTVPPRWLLDLALENALRVMVGLPWEQHVTFLNDASRRRSIKERVAAGVRACAQHPAVLCYAIGNEIPSSIVRWHGRHRIERFLEQLYQVAKDEDPGALVTYVNYPSTEYLQLPFVDFVCFNVFLETGAQFESYLARLQNIAGDRPLVLTETGLDSLRNSEAAQARALDWQVRAAFAGGCAGTFVFAWTDEWYRGGFEIDDWAFGLVDRDRQPKKALEAVGRAFAETPFAASASWPKVSVVVCTYNNEDTLRDCFDGLRRLEYPEYEVIVVNDGSTDRTDEITREYGFHLISTENRGLANARNAGLYAASGEIVAYIDADARPDPYWLAHLATSFQKSSHVGIGGPNIPPPGCSETADCVASAPGGPIHVLLSDEVAEHIPGCNMAFRRWSLEAIEGFDPRFRIAGDDVDICWRLQEQGWTVGFSAGAVVWHHRRKTVKGYLKQQFEYGKAEALLERKWPERYNRAGHLAWAGRVYGNGSSKARGLRRWKVYYGTWGQGLFQSVYQRTPGILGSLPLMPEWYLIIAALAALSALGLVWTPLLLAVPLFALAVGALVYESALGGLRASVVPRHRGRTRRGRMRLTIALMYLLQPASRLAGRLLHGLAPWRRRGRHRLAFPAARTSSVWSEQWRSPDTRLRRIEGELQECKCVVGRGGDYERWDLQVRGGGLGSARMRMAVEEHGGGKQLLRFRIWPRCSRVGLGLVAVFAGLATAAAFDGTWIGAILLGAAAVLIAGSMAHDCAAAMGLIVPAVAHNTDEARPAPEAEASSNGAVPAAIPLHGDVVANGGSPNGHHPERESDIAHGNGANGPAPMQLHESELDVTEHED